MTESVYGWPKINREFLKKNREVTMNGKEIIELLKISKTVFAPYDISYHKLVNSLSALARYYDIKIKTSKGFFINTEGKTEKLIKVELTEGNISSKRKTDTSIKRKVIKSMREEGKTLQEIANVLGCTKQAVSSLLKN